MKIKRKFLPKEEIQKKNFKNSLKDRAYIEGNIPKTGRSLENYSIQLFPDISNPLVYLKNKDYLDLSCGINHMYEKSLLCQLSKSSKKKIHGLDIHNESKCLYSNMKYFKGTSHKLNFPDESYDCITINNYLYFWEYNTENLIKIYKELFRILKPNGEIRIFPIFYSNYDNNNVELIDLLNKYFYIKCLRPEKDYSKESPIYIENNEIKHTHAKNGLNEYRLNHELMSQVLILKKN